MTQSKLLPLVSAILAAIFLPPVFLHLAPLLGFLVLMVSVLIDPEMAMPVLMLLGHFVSTYIIPIQAVLALVAFVVTYLRARDLFSGGSSRRSTEGRTDRQAQGDRAYLESKIRVAVQAEEEPPARTYRI